MKIFPGMHYSMGGLWVDYDHMTNVPGLFAAGEVDYQYHGANRLGANSLLSCIYSGQVAGPSMIRWAKGQTGDAPAELHAREAARQQDAYTKIQAMDGPENAFVIAKEMGEWMTANATVVRHNAKLRETDQKLQELRERWTKVGLTDRSAWANQEVAFVRQLAHMLELARVVVAGAIVRDESRGAHYKPDFPDRRDEQFLKTTKARWTSDGPELSFEPVDTTLITPRPRKYDVASKAA
jgi:succinate dehydrogenase / fumarate reductase flavoprotein subunit